MKILLRRACAAAATTTAVAGVYFLFQYELIPALTALVVTGFLLTTIHFFRDKKQT